MKAIGLIRVSTQAQQLESQSIKVKEAILRDGFQEEDIILIEDKESGSKLSEEERAGLNRLKHYIETEDVSAVYAYEISRISRRASVVFSIRDYLISKGIQLVILNPYFKMLKDDGSLSETSNIFFGIFSSMSENETFIRTERMMRGKEKKTLEGKLATGYPIYGYTVDDKHFIIKHPEQAPIVQEIFERYAGYESSGSIGKDLWLRGCLCAKTDKLISHQTKVCGILREKRYAKIDPGSIYPPLISKELFYKVQEIRMSKPEYYMRKSRTEYVYPLQGFIYSEEGYLLSPSITNNRYLKLNGGSYPVSLNMKGAHGLAKIIINQYLMSGVLDIDRNKQREDLNMLYNQNRVKLAGIDGRITSLQKENDMINSRIIKGRLAEPKGDEMIDANMDEIHSLEDERQTLLYNNAVIDNKLAYLANPFFQEAEIVQAKTDDELKTVVNKYLKKVTVKKLGHSRYRLTFLFNDGFQREGSFYSYCNDIEYYINESGEEKVYKESELNNNR